MEKLLIDKRKYVCIIYFASNEISIELEKVVGY